MSPNSLQTMGQQKGFALIAVLLMLILIMIVGAVAVRQSRVDLAVATSDQINGLTLNAADSSLAYIEQAAGDTSHPQHRRALSGNGVFGYFLVQSASKINHQVSSCYMPGNAEFFNRRQGRTLLPSGGTQGSGGICNPNNASNYISGRNTVMNQVIVVGKEDTLSDNFQDTPTGQSLGGDTKVADPYVQVTSVAVLPSMSKALAANITGCLGRPVGDASLYNVNDGNMNDCLRQNAVPNRGLVEEGRLTNKSEGGYNENADSLTNACLSAECRAASGLS